MKTLTHVTYSSVKTVTRTLAACAALNHPCTTVLSQSAAGGGGGTIGGGTIFYTHTCCRTMWTMNSDGTSQTQLGLGVYGPVSTQKYNGHYFFIDVRPTSIPRYLSERRPRDRSLRLPRRLRPEQQQQQRDKGPADERRHPSNFVCLGRPNPLVAVDARRPEDLGQGAPLVWRPRLRGGTIIIAPVWP